MLLLLVAFIQRLVEDFSRIVPVLKFFNHLFMTLFYLYSVSCTCSCAKNIFSALRNTATNRGMCLPTDQEAYTPLWLRHPCIGRRVVAEPPFFVKVPHHYKTWSQPGYSGRTLRPSLRTLTPQTFCELCRLCFELFVIIKLIFN